MTTLLLALVEELPVDVRPELFENVADAVIEKLGRPLHAVLAHADALLRRIVEAGYARRHTHADNL